jgi:hypothetical protein
MIASMAAMARSLVKGRSPTPTPYDRPVHRAALLAAGVLVALGLAAAPCAAVPPPPDPPHLTHLHPASPTDLFASEQTRLLALQKAKGTAAALRALARSVRRTPSLEGMCHPIAHEIGHAAVTDAGGGPQAAQVALRYRNDVCGGGYTHGVIESALGESTHPERDLLVVCAPANDGSCFHGVGHGLMFATDMNVDRSLDLCDQAPSPLLAGRCGEGVFMQLFSADLSAHHGATGDEARAAHDPGLAARVCQRTRGPYDGNCWFYAPTVWLTAHPEDFSGAIIWCRESAQGAGAHMCAKGVGSRTVKYHPEDLSIGAGVCASAGRLQDSCLQGMGSYWSVERGTAPSTVCRHLGDSTVAARCRAALG